MTPAGRHRNNKKAPVSTFIEHFSIFAVLSNRKPLALRGFTYRLHRSKRPFHELGRVGEGGRKCKTGGRLIAIARIHAGGAFFAYVTDYPWSSFDPKNCAFKGQSRNLAAASLSLRGSTIRVGDL